MSASNLFTVSSDLNVSGPADYMNSRFPALKAEIESGNSYLFNYSIRYKGLSLQSALSITVQTDYATWHGTNQLLSKLK